MTLLRIDSSARQTSVSRQMTERFVAAWRTAHPGGVVIERDLATTVLPPITDDWLATYGDPSQIRPAEQKYLATSDELIAELQLADTIVIGAPMYNLSISASLKAWIDQVVRAGRTFAYGERGPRGLLGGRRVIIATSRGGSYPPPAAADFQEPYLRAIFRFIGLDDITFVHAENQARHSLAEPSRASAYERLTLLANEVTQEVMTYVGAENN